MTCREQNMLNKKRFDRLCGKYVKCKQIRIIMQKDIYSMRTIEQKELKYYLKNLLLIKNFKKIFFL